MIILCDALLTSPVCQQAFGKDYNDLEYVQAERHNNCTPILRGWLKDGDELVVILDDVNLLDGVNKVLREARR